MLLHTGTETPPRFHLPRVAESQLTQEQIPGNKFLLHVSPRATSRGKQGTEVVPSHFLQHFLTLQLSAVPQGPRANTPGSRGCAGPQAVPQSWNSCAAGGAASLSPHLHKQQLLLLPHTRHRREEKPGTETSEPGKASLVVVME